MGSTKIKQIYLGNTKIYSEQENYTYLFYLTLYEANYSTINSTSFAGTSTIKWPASTTLVNSTSAFAIYCTNTGTYVTNAADVTKSFSGMNTYYGNLTNTGIIQLKKYEVDSDKTITLNYKVTIKHNNLDWMVWNKSFNLKFPKNIVYQNGYINIKFVFLIRFSLNVNRTITKVNYGSTEMTITHNTTGATGGSLIYETFEHNDVNATGNILSLNSNFQYYSFLTNEHNPNNNNFINFQYHTTINNVFYLEDIYKPTVYINTAANYVGTWIYMNADPYAQPPNYINGSSFVNASTSVNDRGLLMHLNGQNYNRNANPINLITGQNYSDRTLFIVTEYEYH